MAADSFSSFPAILFQVGPFVLAALSLVLLAVVLWLRRSLAYHWSGIGDDLDSFEAIMSLLPFVALVVGGGLLIAVWFWNHPTHGGEALPAKPPDSDKKVAYLASSRTAGAACPSPIEPGAQPNPLNAGQGATKDIVKALNDIAERLSPQHPESDLTEPLAQITAQLHAIAQQARPGPVSQELTQPIKDVDATLKTLKQANQDQPAVADLDSRLQGVEQRLHDLGDSRVPFAALEAAPLIETLMWDVPPPSRLHCQALPVFRDLPGGPDATERALLDAARQRGLTVARRYQITPRTIFFDPRTPDLSPVGRRILTLTIDAARAHGWALAIMAQSDTGSEGNDAAMVVRKRAANIAQIVARNGPVPVVGIAVSATPGTVSEPYRRVVQVEMLEPCK